MALATPEQARTHAQFTLRGEWPDGASGGVGGKNGCLRPLRRVNPGGKGDAEILLERLPDSGAPGGASGSRLITRDAVLATNKLAPSVRRVLAQGRPRPRS